MTKTIHIYYFAILKDESKSTEESIEKEFSAGEESAGEESDREENSEINPQNNYLFQRIRSKSI